MNAVKKWPDLPAFANECGVLLITPHSAPLALAVLAFLWREKTEREEAEAIRGLNEEAGRRLGSGLRSGAAVHKGAPEFRRCLR